MWVAVAEIAVAVVVFPVAVAVVPAFVAFLLVAVVAISVVPAVVPVLLAAVAKIAVAVLLAAVVAVAVIAAVLIAFGLVTVVLLAILLRGRALFGAGVRNRFGFGFFRWRLRFHRFAGAFVVIRFFGLLLRLFGIGARCFFSGFLAYHDFSTRGRFLHDRHVFTAGFFQGERLLVEDFVDQVLFGKLVDTFDSQLVGYFSEFRNQHFIQLQNIVHGRYGKEKIKCF